MPDVQIMVSVIVSVYNVEKYLRQCLDSIAKQTLKEIEILCVNDGSTDSSLKILEDYAARDSRFRVFTKENEGLGGASARNYGLERAQGKYISILDSDDFFAADMLEKAVRKAESTSADVVVFGGYEYDDQAKTSRQVATILNEGVVPEKEVFSYRDIPDKIFQLSQGMAWNKLYRREFWERDGIRFQRIKYTDDVFFTFAHMVLAERISVLRECLCYYRVNSGSNQTGGLDRYPDSAYVPYLALKDFFVERGVYDEVQRSFLNCAVAFMRYFYDKIESYSVFEYLHNKYRDEVFEALGVKGKPAEYFYDDRSFMWCRQVLDNSAGEIAFKVARAYGSEYTTGILRFQFPYEKIPRNSRIAIVGARLLKRDRKSVV